MDADAWDARYSAAQQWSDEPNALAAELLRDLPPERALDVAAGDLDPLYDAETLPSTAVGLAVERAEQVERPVGDQTAIDTLLLARR